MVMSSMRHSVLHIAWLLISRVPLWQIMMWEGGAWVLTIRTYLNYWEIEEMWRLLCLLDGFRPNSRERWLGVGVKQKGQIYY